MLALRARVPLIAREDWYWSDDVFEYDKRPF
jgi:hypothetical protein